MFPRRCLAGYNLHDRLTCIKSRSNLLKINLRHSAPITSCYSQMSKAMTWPVEEYYHDGPTPDPPLSRYVGYSSKSIVGLRVCHRKPHTDASVQWSILAQDLRGLWWLPAESSAKARAPPTLTQKQPLSTKLQASYFKVKKTRNDQITVKPMASLWRPELYKRLTCRCRSKESMSRLVSWSSARHPSTSLSFMSLPLQHDSQPSSLPETFQVIMILLNPSEWRSSLLLHSWPSIAVRPLDMLIWVFLEGSSCSWYGEVLGVSSGSASA